MTLHSRSTPLTSRGASRHPHGYPPTSCSAHTRAMGGWTTFGAFTTILRVEQIELKLKLYTYCIIGLAQGAVGILTSVGASIYVEMN